MINILELTTSLDDKYTRLTKNRVQKTENTFQVYIYFDTENKSTQGALCKVVSVLFDP